jgi:hypothetical protein
VRTMSGQRVLCTLVVLALLPAALELPALATLGLLAAVLVVLIAYEAMRFAAMRERVRHEVRAEA